MNFPSLFKSFVALALLSACSPRFAFADDSADEARQIAVLQSQASPHDKDAACAWLKVHGSAKSVAALAALLSDAQLSHSARYALESLRGAEAENALIAALEKTSGLTKAGIVNSLGVRADAAAVSELSKLLADSDAQVARASAAALGNIASPEATRALSDEFNTSKPAVPDAVIDGCLRQARQLFLAGKIGPSHFIYQKIFEQPSKDFFHVAAFRGLVQTSGEKGAALISDALLLGPASLQMAAIQMVHEKELPGATKQIAALLPKLNPLAQVALLDALSQREDPAAVPEIAALAKSPDADVCMAAIGALGNLGDDNNLPLLVEIAATISPAQTAARQALQSIHRGTPNSALLKLLLISQGAAQVEIVRALNNRGAAEAVPQLMKLARQADDAAQPVILQALAWLVDQPQLNDFVQTVGELPTESARAAAAEALGLACKHIQARRGTVDLSPVLAALKNGSPEMRVALLPVCSSVADPQVRAVLRACVADANANVHVAAVRALCRTTDAELVPDVVKIAAENSDEEIRALAVEAVVRLTTQEESISLQNSERLKYFQKITPVASTISEKRLLLSGLAALPDTGALKLAEPFLADATVHNEAALAVLGICRKLPDGETAKVALEKIVSDETSDQIKQDAQVQLKLIAARANYITVWQITGPYRQAGKNFSALFDIPFPPETASAPNENWRDIAASSAAETPWEMDLLKAIGGEQEVAYARTSIQSPSEQAAWLIINSDDGVKVWLNGEPVYANNASRAITSPADKVKITLKSGWNNLLLKVTQNTQGWGFGVRLTDLNGAPLTGLQFVANPANTGK